MRTNGAGRRRCMGHGGSGLVVLHTGQANGQARASARGPYLPRVRVKGNPILQPPAGTGIESELSRIARAVNAY